MRSITATATLALAAMLAVPAAAQTWTQLTPGASPTPRRSGSVAFDRNTGRLLIHGGLTSGPTASNGETWSFDGTTWAPVVSATTPPNRWGHRMVYDTARNRIVVFGGRSPTLTTSANDTWEWDGTDWQQIATPVSPTARAFYSMAYDERRQRTVMFGSMSTFDGFQTWEYDGTTWALVATPTTMVSRETPGMCYDRGRGVIVLFGGWYAVSPGTMFNDTWEYDGIDWRQVVTPTSPPGRYRASMVYDERRGRVVLSGGYGAGALQDVWEYDGSDWAPVGSGGTTKSTECYTDFDERLGRIVLFGGSGPGGNSNETWVYDGPHTALFNTFGAGCAASLGVPTLGAAQPPRQGQVFQLDVGNLANTASCVLALGFDNHRWGPLRLPFDLGAVQAAGCWLEIAPDVAVTLPVSGGTALLQLFVANSASLIDAPLFAQALVLDLGSPNGVAGASNGAHAVIGQ